MNVISNKKFYISVGAITLFVACLPLFTLNCIGGHDIAYHLLRIEALKAGILAGRPFLRINMLFFGGMGYASSLFYPDLFLYFPAVLRLLFLRQIYIREQLFRYDLGGDIYAVSVSYL